MDSDDLLARLEADLVTLCAEADVPGASVFLSWGSQVVAATAGVVNARTQVPVTADAIFQIQSVTKIFTATLVLQLVDEGLLDLDDPVQMHLPEFRTADPDSSKRITVRHLLTHTGGFEGDLWQPTTWGDDALDRFVPRSRPARQRSTARRDNGSPTATPGSAPWAGWSRSCAARRMRTRYAATSPIHSASTSWRSPRIRRCRSARRSVTCVPSRPLPYARRTTGL